MRQAAVYARVSSERQKEEQTIASQVEAMLTYAQQNDYVVPEDWVFLDEGYSGATLLRPALDRLRDLAARGALEAVLVYSPDRLSRKYAYQVLLLEEFSRYGTEVTFINAPAGSGPEHELLLQFKGMIAEYEKAQIIERTRRGKLYKARMGSVNVLSGAPYGYRYVRRTEDMAAYYEVHPGEAEIVRSIYKWYVQEWLSIGEIARRLTQQGTPTRTGKTHWDRSVVWAILRNPAYKGTACFRKTGLMETKPRVTRRVRLQGLTIPRRKATRERPPEERIEIPVPAIVTPEEYAIAQERLLENKLFSTRRTIEPTLLTGLLVCRQCGYTYYRSSTRTSKRKLYYYRCLGADNWRWENGRICDNKPVRQDYLDALVWDHITRLLSQPQLVVDEICRRLEELKNTHPALGQKEQLEAELNHLTKARLRIVEAYQEGLIDIAELRQRGQLLRQRELAMKAQIHSLEAQMVDAQRYLQLTENVHSFLGRLEAAASTLSIPDRQKVLRLLVKQIEVGHDSIVIKNSIPVSGTGRPKSYLLRRGGHQSVTFQHIPDTI